MAGIVLPVTSLVVLCGVPGCGKSTFAARHFRETAIVSSDRCRLQVSDSETNMAASREAFQLFYCTIERRLSLGRLTVADSTALTRRARANLLHLGKKYGFYVALIIFDVPIATCLARNFSRERKVVKKVIESMGKKLAQTLATAGQEGFDAVYVLTEKDLSEPGFKVEIRKHEVTLQGPFDLFGDVSGFFHQFVLLLKKLGYRRKGQYFAHPQGRRAVFLGDLTGRGPHNLDTFWLAKSMVDAGTALYVPGDLCHHFSLILEGKGGQLVPEIKNLLAEWEALPSDERENFKEEYLKMYYSAPLYLILDGGKLVVSHTLNWEEAGREKDGEEKGLLECLPSRQERPREYRESTLIVYSHTPPKHPLTLASTEITGQRCIYVRSLTALRYPERELVHV